MLWIMSFLLDISRSPHPPSQAPIAIPRWICHSRARSNDHHGAISVQLSARLQKYLIQHASSSVYLPQLVPSFGTSNVWERKLGPMHCAKLEQQRLGHSRASHNKLQDLLTLPAAMAMPSHTQDDKMSAEDIDLFSSLILFVYDFIVC